MRKEVYTRKRSSQASTNKDTIFSRNEHVFIDTGELAPPFRFFGMEHTYLGGKNIMSLTNQFGWNHLKPDLVYVAATNLFENSRIFMQRYGKIKTIDSVVQEWKLFLNQIDYAIGNLPQETKLRSNLIKELMRLKIPAETILNGLKSVVYPCNPEIENISELLGIFKSIPIDLHDRRKARIDKIRTQEKRPALPTDELLFATTIYDSIFEEKNAAVITKDCDLNRMMHKALGYLRRDSTSFTRKLCKSGPAVYHQVSSDLYDMYTFRNCNPELIEKKDLDRFNGNLNELVTKLTLKYEDIMADRNPSTG